MTPWVVVCLVAGAASLLAPSEPSFDPWAWLVWGREIAQLSLDTTSGPSWKPLPVAFTALVAPLSQIDDQVPPALWVVVARAGGLLAVVLAAKLAARLVGGGALRRMVAGGVAALGLLLTPNWVGYLFHASEAPLSVGLALWAVDRHLDRRRSSAFVLGAIVCLARPELFGFLLLYGAWLCWRSPGSRALVVGLALLVVAAWLVPSWLGSGDPFAAGAQARSEPSWSLSHAAHPWRAALEVAQREAWVVLELTALAALALSVPRRMQGALLPRPARPAAVAVLAGFGVAIVAMYAAMTQAGFSGNARYVLPALVTLSVVGAVGVALLLDLGRRSAPAGAAIGCLLLVASAPELRYHLQAANFEASEAIERARLHEELERAVDTIGAGYIRRFGPATTNRSYQTHLAWELSQPISAVHGTGGRGIVLSAPARPVAGVVRIYPRARRRTTIARIGAWTVSARAANAKHVFSWPIVGFSLRVAATRHAPCRAASPAKIEQEWSSSPTPATCSPRSPTSSRSSASSPG